MLSYNKLQYTQYHSRLQQYLHIAQAMSFMTTGMASIDQVARGGYCNAAFIHVKDYM